MSTEISNTSTSSGSAGDVSRTYRKPVKDEPPQSPPAKEASPAAVSAASDSSRFSRETSDPRARASLQNAEEGSDRFRNSLWDSVRQNSIDSSGRAPESQGARAQDAPGVSPSIQSARDDMAKSLDEAGRALPRGANPTPAPVPNNNQDSMQQVQQQMMQTMMQMQQMMLQQMQMMTQMMQQMTGRNGGQNNNNNVAPINNNNNNNNALNNNNANAPRQWGNLISSWRQGSEGNCVSVATIKSAMLKFGNQVFDRMEKTGDGGYNLTLKDGKTVSLTAAELATAGRMSSFRGSGEEADYAKVCYAAMAKRALENRHEGASSFARACQSLNNGEQIEYPMKLLGMMQFAKKISLRELSNYNNVITWNRGHCLFASNGAVDGYGRETSASRWGLHGAYAIV